MLGEMLMMGLGSAALGALGPKQKYVDPRSPQQRALEAKIASLISKQIDTGHGLTGAQRNYMLADILGTANKGYKDVIKDIDNSNYDPLSRRALKGKATRSRAKDIALGHQNLNLQDALGYNNMLGQGQQISQYAPPIQQRTSNPSFLQSFASNLSGPMGYIAGKGVDSYGTQKGWWS